MIIDSHVHVYPPSFRERRDEIAARDATFRELYANPDAVLADAADNLLTAMDEAGVDVAVAVGIGWTDREVAREANDYLAECRGAQRRTVAGIRLGEPRVGGRRPRGGGAVRRGGTVGDR